MKKEKSPFNLEKIILRVLEELTIGTFKSFYAHPYYHIFCKHNNPKSIYKTLNILERKGLVKKYADKKEREYILTQEGKKKSKSLAILMKLADLFIGPKKSSWDGKWRIVIFDIPEKLRQYRDELRMNLKILSFYQLQKSVWVHPLPIPKNIFEEFIRPPLRPYIRIAVIESIDQEKELNEFFFGK